MPPDQCERTNSMTPKIVSPISRSVSRRQSMLSSGAGTWWVGIERTAHKVISYSGEVFYPAAPDKNY